MTKKQPESLTEKLGTLRELVARSQFPEFASAVHREAHHSDHRVCVTLGLNATYEMMARDGSQGSYFTMDEQGKIYEQGFIQGPDAHIYSGLQRIAADEFERRIRALPRENMANLKEVLRNINDYLPKRRPTREEKHEYS